jgi:hypothetical protein
MPSKAKPKVGVKKSSAVLDPVALQAAFGLASFAILGPLFKALSDKGVITREELEGIVHRTLANLQSQQSQGAPQELYKWARHYLEGLGFASEVTRDQPQTPRVTNGEQT